MANQKSGGLLSILGKIIPIIIIIYLFVGLHNICSVSSESKRILDAEKSKPFFTKSWKGMLYTFGNFTGNTTFGIQILQCHQERASFVAKSYGVVKDILGFSKDFYDFLPDLILGAFVGLWLHLTFLLASSETHLARFKLFAWNYSEDKTKLSNSWLWFVGSSAWKIVPIAMGYALLMQIPLVNTAINIVSLAWLLFYKGWWGYALKSFILAFYIGFLPSWFEAFIKFRYRRHYDQALVRAKYKKEIENMELESR